jgi:hypothetical protein
MDFLVDGQVPADETEARRVTRRSKGYTIVNKEIYKRSATGVLQRCVESAEGLEMLREIHQGECGHHASSRALVAKVFRHGFYLLTALQEADVTPQNRHLADYSDQATIYMMSLWKRTTKRLVHIATCT